ncbi:MAG: alpha-L-arabinofuranosidase C-terminal domain-containing protein, partial [Prolixibacteraceae bacterium]
YQQNTLRDAMVAAVNLDLFNTYCRRVKMANIAQTVNVLQAMILTKDDEIVKTPSYYVFKMYKVHHDATLLPADVTTENYSCGDEEIPAISTSASKSDDGKIHITISNLNPGKSLNVTCELRGLAKDVSFENGSIITAEKISSYNDFGQEEKVNINSFDDVSVSGNQVVVELPAKSIVMLELN